MIKRWSYSALQTYDQCPKKLKYQKIDKIVVEKGAALQRGIDVHSEIEDYFNDEGVLESDPALDFEAYFSEIKTRDTEQQQEQMWVFNPDWRYLGTVDFAKNRWPQGEHWLYAKLDHVEVDHDAATVIVRDWKTGKERPEEHEKQCDLYAVCASIIWPDYFIEAHMVYVDQGTVTEYSDYPAKKLQRLKKMFAKKGNRLLNEKVWPATPGWYCKWCDFAQSKGGPCKEEA